MKASRSPSTESPTLVVRHGIDGKVSAGQVFLDCVEQFHRVRVPTVCIFTIGPEGGDLVLFTIFLYRNSPMLYAGKCTSKIFEKILEGTLHA